MSIDSQSQIYKFYLDWLVSPRIEAMICLEREERGYYYNWIFVGKFYK
jgi:hypothetical protein